ncbi:hypothetical protein LTS09_014319 [Friedmanniomyces endolithicus]|nr:hypothetical protein LTS09_014319 [Friedmanniomyces endolithicus]
MSMHEEHERTIEENAVMEQNRQAWAEGLATGAIRFYRRGWQDFENDENEHGDARPGAETSPDDRQTVSTRGGQRSQATGGAEARRVGEIRGTTDTMPAEWPYDQSLRDGEAVLEATSTDERTSISHFGGL